MNDPETRARYAQGILENEVFQEVCAEQEKAALDRIRNALTTDELVMARAKLLAVADLHKAFQVIVERNQFNQARSGKLPLA